MVYVGSKSRLAKYIVPILQSYIDENNIKTYIEPFVGGANIIDKIKCDRKIGVDLHPGLISIYRNIQQGWEPPLTITEQNYKEAKGGNIEEPLKSYIGFNASYGSKYFGGFARCFKSDGTTPRDRYNEKTRTFIKQIPYLQNIDFYCVDYTKLNGSGAVIYCDPPYQNTTKYSTGNFDHEAFWQWVRTMSKANMVFVSEFSAPEDFKSIWSKERACSLDKDTGGKTKTERLFILED